MKPTDLEDLYELSPLQQGILFHCLTAPDPGVYLITMTYGVKGRVDVPAFERAWQRTVDRNPILRTSFHWKDIHKPLQIVQRSVRLACEELDWRGLAPQEQEARLSALLEQERTRAYPLERAPLMRLILVRTGDERHRLIWTFHHILLEGWSASLVLDEVFAHYRSLRRGEELELAPRRPYRDFILWLQQRDPSRAEAYWRGALEGFSSPTSLPLPRPSALREGEEVYGRQRLSLSASPSAAVASLARRNQLTLNTVLQGGWALLLSRYSGDEDVLFGSVVSGRQEGLPEAGSMIGLFVNTLPARVAVPPEARVLPWLKELQDRLAVMREFEHTPLVQAQGWSGVPRGTRLFESIFAFENWVGDISLRGWAEELEVEDIRVIEGGIGYPLLVEAGPGAQISATFTHDRRQFDDATVARIIADYQNLIEGMIASPNGRLSELTLLGQADQHRLVVEWNDTARDYPQDVCVHELVERQARETPEAVAVVFEGASLTYAELDRRSSQVANHLRRLGAGPEVRVGIYCERSLEMVTGLLGILKAGAAYVPLDPSHPGERVALVLEDAGVPLVLTQERLRSLLPPTRARVVCLDADRETISRESAASPGGERDAESLAYVIHTSGSTGRPKGVQVSHRAVVNFLLSMRDRPGFTRDDILLSVTTLSFDIFGLELYLPLMVGGRVVLVSREVASDGNALAEALARSDATVMQATPATWRMLLEAGWAGSSRIKVLCGGEALPPELARQLLPRCGALWNLYGPTETTIWSAVHPVEAADGVMPLGHPIANTRMYVLDRGLNLAPVGIPGELHIGGHGLARGYLNRPEMTAAKFIPDPFGGVPGGRLYRTGDLARWRQGGVLEFLGRTDHQVKLRGFRIEPGEIEAVLRRHPDVREATVLARQDMPGEKQLVAYVVPGEGKSPPIPDLRAFLRARLPEYMVPSAFVPLWALPLTPNGKVDRRALPPPDRSLPELGGTFLSPRTPVEETVAGIWREVLRVERVGVHDNFFDLGGHSLLLVRVHGRLRESFPERDVSAVDLFRHSTIAALAAYLSPAPGPDCPPPADAAADAARREAGQERLARRRAIRVAPADTEETRA